MTQEKAASTPQLQINAAALDIQCTDLIGRRLLNIYGYQQQNLVDLLDDESSWWLEFERGVWANVKSIIAPAVVDTPFQLQFRFYYASQFPLLDRASFTKNPPELAPLLGLQLLEQMESVYDDAHLSAQALRLGFGGDGSVTTELHIGYLDAQADATFPGMAASALSLETTRSPKPSASNNGIDGVMRLLIAIADAERARLGIKPADRHTFWKSKWAGPFHIARKITGVLLITLGLLLAWEMTTMLASSDFTRKVLFGFGGIALMLIIGGVLCLIAKRGENAFD